MPYPIWAMAEGPEQRLCKSHRMLPVLIEANLEPRADVKDLLVNAISGGLKELIGEPEPIFEELLLQLLRKRRVLVIVDSLSELDEATRKSVRPTDPNSPIAALVVTSRIEEPLGGASKSLLRPLRLKSNRLSEFIDGYLKQLGKRDLFDDEEYFDACRRLSQLVGDRDITVLIAKMYAEQMVAAKEADAGAQTGARELPRNLPDLMLGYVKRLNDQVQADRQDIHKVVGVAKVVAWECLKQTCRPSTAKRADVLKALSGEASVEALLEYLEKRLHLIQTAGPISELFRFSLDPLAEYLAALYLVERCGKNEERWREFFDRAKGQPGAPETIKGFLLAILDCCAEKGSDSGVPGGVQAELARLAGLDPEVINAAQLKQRISRLVNNLKLPDAEDRRIAAELLGYLKSAAKEAIPALIATLKDQDILVSHSAETSLAMIGPGTVDAVPTLIAALKDQKAIVRNNAAFILGRMGSVAKDAVPSLITALKDEDVKARHSAAYALGEIGPAAVPALITALQDQDEWVRRSAVSTLGKIGPAAKEAVPLLIVALRDQNERIRRSAADALVQIGAAEEVEGL